MVDVVDLTGDDDDTQVQAWQASAPPTLISRIFRAQKQSSVGEMRPSLGGNGSNQAISLISDDDDDDNNEEASVQAPTAPTAYDTPSSPQTHRLFGSHAMHTSEAVPAAAKDMKRKRHHGNTAPNDTASDHQAAQQQQQQQQLNTYRHPTLLPLGPSMPSLAALSAPSAPAVAEHKGSSQMPKVAAKTIAVMAAREVAAVAATYRVAQSKTPETASPSAAEGYGLEKEECDSIVAQTQAQTQAQAQAQQEGQEKVNARAHAPTQSRTQAIAARTAVVIQAAPSPCVEDGQSTQDPHAWDDADDDGQRRIAASAPAPKVQHKVAPASSGWDSTDDDSDSESDAEDTPQRTRLEPLPAACRGDSAAVVARALQPVEGEVAQRAVRRVDVLLPDRSGIGAPRPPRLRLERLDRVDPLRWKTKNE